MSINTNLTLNVDDFYGQNPSGNAPSGLALASGITNTSGVFFGASLHSANFVLGWGGERSSAQFSVVEDDRLSQTFQKPLPGTPARVNLGALEFGGIVQHWKQSNNFSSNPTYDISMVDPRDILAGAQIITDQYVGNVRQDPNTGEVYSAEFGISGLTNIINAYGAYAFGQAGVNDTGMPWNKIKPVLELAKLHFMGYEYHLDLTDMPGMDSLNGVLPNPGVYFKLPNSHAVTISGFPQSFGYYGESNDYDNVRNLNVDANGNPVVGVANYNLSPEESGLRQTFVDLTSSNQSYFGTTIYRVTGKPTVSILEAVDQVCFDSGRDYFVTLDIREQQDDAGVFTGYRNVIKINTVDRTAPPPSVVDRIQYFVTQSSGIVNDYSFGQELRNETTSVMLLGGSVKDMYQANSMMPFWGYDYLGNPIISATTFNLDVRQLNLFNYPYDYYATDVTEMRAVLGGKTTWEAWIHYTKPQLADYLGIQPSIKLNKIERELEQNGFRAPVLNAAGQVVVPGGTPVANPVFTVKLANLVNTDKKVAQRYKNAMASGWSEFNTDQLYNYLNKVATTHYGKSFAVQIPTPSRYIDATTGDTKYSIEPTDAAWVESNYWGQPPLNLDGVNTSIFETEDLRFKPFVRFDYYNRIYNNVLVNRRLEPSGVGILDISAMDPSDYCVQANPITDVFSPLYGKSVPSLYVKAEVEEKVVFLESNVGPTYSFSTNLFQRAMGELNSIVATQTALAIVTLPEPVRVVVSGSFPSYMGMFNLYKEQLEKEFQPLGVKLALETLIASGPANNTHMPAEDLVLIPDWAAVPLKSNVNFYGPWMCYISGVQGKAEVIYDESLVPWEYGGYTYLNGAAREQAMRAANAQQIQEMGSVTVAGLPSKNIGDKLVFNGPVITNINIGWGRNGVTTTYNMQTYTRKFGDFGKYRQSQFQRTGRALNRFSNSLRNAPLYSLPQFSLFGSKTGGGVNSKYRSNTDQVLSSTAAGLNVLASQGSGTDVGISKLEYLMGHTNLEGEHYELTAGAEMKALVRGYSTNPSGQMGPRFAMYYDASGNLPSGYWNGFHANVTHPNRDDLNPFKLGHDMFVLSGSGYLDPFDATQSGYTGPNSTSGNFDPTRARPIALRTPLMLAGWGYDIEGGPVPDNGSLIIETMETIASGVVYTISGYYNYPSGVVYQRERYSKGTQFKQDYLTNPSSWKVGPLEVRWNNDRQIWQSVPNAELAVVVNLGSIPAASGSGNNYARTRNLRPIYVCNRNLNMVGSGAELDIQYDPLDYSNAIEVINIQEGAGSTHTIGVGSLVVLNYNQGIAFMNEHVRTFTRRTGYQE